MLIVFLTAGSRGDIQPYIALGVALRKAGHHVRIATFQNYATWIKSFELEHVAIRGDISQVVNSQNVQGARYSDTPLKLMKSFNTLRELAADLNLDFFNACSGADAIVYHPGPSIGYFIAQRMQIPAILATPFPMMPTRQYPSLIFYNSPRLGRTFNLLSHKIFERMMWFVSKGAIRKFWVNQFGAIPAEFTCPFPKQITKQNPTIISCSEHIFPRSPEWSTHIHMNGYWFLDEEPGWLPPADLLTFLQKGTPPVYVGFGSIGDPSEAERSTHLVIEALQSAGQRGILVTGWNGMTKIVPPPEGIFFVESAPHAWLFPMMAAVVHHGGAGTTAAGLRAGVPSVIIPYGNDQFAWARRVYELGAGVAPLPRKRLTAQSLSAAITSALREDVKTRAADLGMKIRNENGAEAAAQVIMNSLSMG